MTAMLRIAPHDNVAVALAPVARGAPLPAGGVAIDSIPAGHKVAVTPIAAGAPVLKFGQAIGTATTAIAAGEHVHRHNLAFEKHDGRVVTTAAAPSVQAPARFEGYVRADGRVGTRNYIGILTSVNCSASVARRIAQHFSPERLASYGNVDGVVALGHASGCGMAEGAGLANLRRTLGGYARHPNFAGVLLVGLGCEVNRPEQLDLPPDVAAIGIQEVGGSRAAIGAGIAAVEAMLPRANAARRQSVSAEHLVVGLQCGGSDGYSALTANPALGLAADRLVAAGGSVLLSETPEIFGAENLLLARAASSEVAAALLARLEWWEAHAAAGGASLDNNPSPGNLAGGLTTILEKSLGAVAKSGSTPLEAVIDYAAPLPRRGFIFMDSPGYDPCSATGQIASGATLIAFTTGRGSVFGSVPAPTLKLASNSDLARRMPDDIDVDCGRLLTGEVTLEALGADVFAALLAVASGQRTASEREGVGEAEFVPWTPGVTL
jgi:altronate hydrolase